MSLNKPREAEAHPARSEVELLLSKERPSGQLAVHWIHGPFGCCNHQSGLPAAVHSLQQHTLLALTAVGLSPLAAVHGKDKVDRSLLRFLDESSQVQSASKEV